MGERITFEGFGNKPDAQLNPKKNVFGKLAPDLLTSAGKPVFLRISWPWCAVSERSIGTTCR